MDFIKHTQQFLEGDLLSYTKERIFDCVETLRIVLRFHSHHYYNNTPVISDGEYDKLFSALGEREKKYPELITDNSPTQLIGAPPIDGFEKKSHASPMLSLQNTYNGDDIRQRHEFLERQLEKHEITSWTYCVEAKLDGSSVEVIYEYGKLSGGVTRGDGMVGEDISMHIRRVQNLPSFVESRKNIAAVHLRGEVVMSQTAFNKTNEFQVQEGLAPFANPRNAAAGTLRQLDTMLTEKRGLSCFVYDLLYTTQEDTFPTDDTSLLECLSENKLPVFDWYTCVDSLDDLIALCADEKVRKQTQEGSVGCDGLVIKLNEYKLREMLGDTQHHPRRAMAYKYPTQEIAAHIQSIDFQVGRTGVVTPLAVLEPVAIGGVVVSKATLHNFDFIKDRDIRVGDRVWIKRSGEVIPYVIGPIVQRRTDDVTAFETPQKCPICLSKLDNDGVEVALYCTNDGCSGKLIAQLQHFVSKQCMNIQGLGDALIEQLVQAEIVTSITGLYKLVVDETWPVQKQTLATLPGLGEKKIMTLYGEIHESKNNDLRRLLHGLGIRGVGKKVSMSLAVYLQEKYAEGSILSLKRIQKHSTIEELSGVFGIGKILAADITEFFHGPHGSTQIQSLIDLGVAHKKQFEKQQASGSKEMDGEIVVLTGSMPYPREKIAWVLEKHGATMTGSVSGKTTLLVAGEKAGSKLKKAEELGIKVLSYDALIIEYEWLLSALESASKQETVEKNKSTQSYMQNGLFG